ncbi:conserved exported hypothetical protein [uncultured Eubacteriales bacterium]|uniref:DUF4363 family protein n=1 Tax=uncultured Eubacteriales bacterium TaxID=172733 RepID=A0A212JJS2_9FIRM|nr:conserved exported hypothetical protein [uncultured Eubacteriales bacterium]
MKRLYIALAILAVVFAATLYNAYFLNQLTSDITTLLDRAESRAKAEDWRSATKLTTQANDLWEDHTLYLHVFLRHSNIDEVETGFREVWEFLLAEERTDYAAANAHLIEAVSMLYEAEQFSLKNIL